MEADEELARVTALSPLTLPVDAVHVSVSSRPGAYDIDASIAVTAALETVLRRLVGAGVKAAGDESMWTGLSAAMRSKKDRLHRRFLQIALRKDKELARLTTRNKGIQTICDKFLDSGTAALLEDKGVDFDATMILSPPADAETSVEDLSYEESKAGGGGGGGGGEDGGGGSDYDDDFESEEEGDTLAPLRGPSLSKVAEVEQEMIKAHDDSAMAWQRRKDDPVTDSDLAALMSAVNPMYNLANDSLIFMAALARELVVLIDERTAAQLGTPPTATSASSTSPLRRGLPSSPNAGVSFLPSATASAESVFAAVKEVLPERLVNSTTKAAMGAIAVKDGTFEPPPTVTLRFKRQDGTSTVATKSVKISQNARFGEAVVKACRLLRVERKDLVCLYNGKPVRDSDTPAVLAMPAVVPIYAVNRKWWAFHRREEARRGLLTSTRANEETVKSFRTKAQARVGQTTTMTSAAAATSASAAPGSGTTAASRHTNAPRSFSPILSKRSITDDGSPPAGSPPTIVPPRVSAVVPSQSPSPPPPPRRRIPAAPTAASTAAASTPSSSSSPSSVVPRVRTRPPSPSSESSAASSVSPTPSPRSSIAPAPGPGPGPGPSSSSRKPSGIVAPGTGPRPQVATSVGGYRKGFGFQPDDARRPVASYPTRHRIIPSPATSLEGPDLAKLDVLKESVTAQRRRVGGVAKLPRSVSHSRLRRHRSLSPTGSAASDADAAAGPLSPTNRDRDRDRDRDRSRDRSRDRDRNRDRDRSSRRRRAGAALPRRWSNLRPAENRSRSSSRHSGGSRSRSPPHGPSRRTQSNRRPGRMPPRHAVGPSSSSSSSVAGSASSGQPGPPSTSASTASLSESAHRSQQKQLRLLKKQQKRRLRALAKKQSGQVVVSPPQQTSPVASTLASAGTSGVGAAALAAPIAPAPTSMSMSVAVPNPTPSASAVAVTATEVSLPTSQPVFRRSVTSPPTSSSSSSRRLPKLDGLSVDVGGDPSDSPGADDVDAGSLLRMSEQSISALKDALDKVTSLQQQLHTRLPNLDAATPTSRSSGPAHGIVSKSSLRHALQSLQSIAQHSDSVIKSTVDVMSTFGESMPLQPAPVLPPTPVVAGSSQQPQPRLPSPIPSTCSPTLAMDQSTPPPLSTSPLITTSSVARSSESPTPDASADRGAGGSPVVGDGDGGLESEMRRPRSQFQHMRMPSTGEGVETITADGAGQCRPPPVNSNIKPAAAWHNVAGTSSPTTPAHFEMPAAGGGGDGDVNHDGKANGDDAAPPTDSAGGRDDEPAVVQPEAKMVEQEAKEAKEEEEHEVVEERKASTPPVMDDPEVDLAPPVFVEPQPAVPSHPSSAAGHQRSRSVPQPTPPTPPLPAQSQSVDDSAVLPPSSSSCTTSPQVTGVPSAALSLSIEPSWAVSSNLPPSVAAADGSRSPVPSEKVLRQWFWGTPTGTPRSARALSPITPALDGGVKLSEAFPDSPPKEGPLGRRGSRPIRGSSALRRGVKPVFSADAVNDSMSLDVSFEEHSYLMASAEEVKVEASHAAVVDSEEEEEEDGDEDGDDTSVDTSPDASPVASRVGSGRPRRPSRRISNAKVAPMDVTTASAHSAKEVELESLPSPAPPPHNNDVPFVLQSPAPEPVDESLVVGSVERSQDVSVEVERGLADPDADVSCVMEEVVVEDVTSPEAEAEGGMVGDLVVVAAAVPKWKAMQARAAARRQAPKFDDDM